MSDKPQWAELFTEVVTSGLCTGCAACVIACPKDVLEYDRRGTIPFHIADDGGLDNCTHGERGCTLCTRACPRFRHWESEADHVRHGRDREVTEVAGIGDVYLTRATSADELAAGQDGGFVSAILNFLLERGDIDAALVGGLDETEPWRTAPAVIRTRDEVEATAGSRYTYSPNLLAYPAAAESGAEKMAVVGMGCMVSAPAVMAARKTGKTARRLGLTIGLLCSKTFDEEIFDGLFLTSYGIRREDIVKMNIKGVFQLWLADGRYVEVPLKEAHAFTRSGCKSCPDFAAEHADISAGGIGAFSEWTLTIVRTELGRTIFNDAVAAGVIEVRPGSDDPGAIALMNKLSTVSRKRWPEWAQGGPRRIPVTSA